jgi:hypothetical protein
LPKGSATRKWPSGYSSAKIPSRPTPAGYSTNYFGIRSYRDNVLGGTISFGRGVQAGLLITLISCAFYVATWLVLYYAFMPDFGDKYAAYLIDNLRASGGSQAEVDAMIKQTEVYKEWFRNPFMNAAVSFTEPFPVGLLVTLISAAVLKKHGRD